MRATEIKRGPSRALLALFLLFPAALLPQMPPQPGRLAISSEPQGADIYINGPKMSQPTPAVFVVSPGQYSILVQSPDGRYKCQVFSTKVNAGQTVPFNCALPGWNPKQ
jgi:hypothetical protein